MAHCRKSKTGGAGDGRKDPKDGPDVVFKRRDPRSWTSWMREMVYPTGGIKRATLYVYHRMRRLPDQPHKVARGVFAGLFIGCLPIPGFQFLGGGLMAWAMRGNILAGLLGTFISNPLTTPLIAVGSIWLGHWILGIHRPLTGAAIGSAFADAGEELWNNSLAVFGPEPVHWSAMGGFLHDLYLPYLVGSIIIGIPVGLIGYYLTIPAVHAYQKARSARFRARAERRRAASPVDTNAPDA